MRTIIVIPARYPSTRLPGKPLVMIAGRTMLERVVALSRSAASGLAGVEVIVATDEGRISEHCQEIGVPSVMTPSACPSGTDRVAEAIRRLGGHPDFVINMQGDAPLTPPSMVRALIESFAAAPTDIVTPVTQLSWDELDALRRAKATTPFSGTCAVFDSTSGRAYWFSKQILPAIRREERYRSESRLSPVFRHIGLYGDRREMLDRYATLPEGRFEKLEGLEQLRALEHGYTIRCVPVETEDRPTMSGIDSPEDVTRAEELIRVWGDPFDGSTTT
jgi:3-deoxy-manno-octulosonate cytidylyltransferase (CMP-KDO synthetase)